MSLLKRQQERERKAAEEAARLAEEKKLRDMAVHPLVKAGRNRDMRDAYLYGLVFAAIADDDKVDKNEKEALTDIAVSLCIPVEEVNDAIGRATSLPDENKFALIDECIETIKGCEIGVKLFYSQFMLLWALHEDEAGELDEYLLRFVDKTGVAFPMAKRHAVLKILEGGEGVDGAMDAIADWMGDDALKYFAVKKYGDVSGLLKRIRDAKASARKKECEKRRVQKVRAEFHDNCMNTGRKYGAQASVPHGWQDEFNRLFDGIEDRDINWVDECNSILVRLNKLDPLMWHERKTKMRQIAWMILCMQFVHREKVEADAPIRWLRSISSISITGFKSKVKEFLTNYFGDVVEIP